MTFDELRAEAIAHYRKGDFAGSLALIEREGVHFPDQAWDIGYWRVCMNSLLGRTDLALKILSGLIEAGNWYSVYMLRNDPDLAALQGYPEFERLYRICDERRALAQAAARPLRLTVEPEGEAGPAPLVMELHGNGRSAALEVEQWRPLSANGWRVAMLQSAEVGTPSGFVWDDLERATTDVCVHYAELAAERPVRDGKVLLGGFSMGAGRAIILSLAGSVPALGFVVLAPWLPDVAYLRTLLDARVPAGLRGYIVVGDADRESFRISQEVQALLAEYGLAVEIEVHPGMGHVYPERFTESLDRALAFINAR